MGGGGQNPTGSGNSLPLSGTAAIFGRNFWTNQHLEPVVLNGNIIWQSLAFRAAIYLLRSNISHPENEARRELVILHAT